MIDGSDAPTETSPSLPPSAAELLWIAPGKRVTLHRLKGTRFAYYVTAGGTGIVLTEIEAVQLVQAILRDGDSDDTRPDPGQPAPKPEGCPKCGKGPCFVPPSAGEAGFYLCEAKREPEN